MTKTKKSNKNNEMSPSRILLMILSVIWLIVTMVTLATLRVENTLIQFIFLAIGAMALSWSIYAKSFQGSPIKYLAIFIFGLIIAVISYLVFAYVWFGITQPPIGY